jgi:hypothetical protein
MRTGTVIYLTDAASAPPDFDEERAVLQLGLDPDWTLVAASLNGFHAMEEATLRLIERGAGSIEAVRAALTEEGSLRLFGDRMRVYG